MKTLLKNLVFLIVVLFASGLLISKYMEVKAAPETFTDPARVPTVDAVIVPGASVYRSGKLSPVLKQRMEAALALVKRRPGVKLVLSGHTVPQGYSETKAMRDFAVKRGFPPRDVILDEDGRSTFLTLFNGQKKFGLRRVALVSQGYHLPRALYIARRLGMTGYGLRVETNAAHPSGATSREWFSRIKDFALVRIFRYFH
jgi:vancomycin permeability regulator SanA